MKPIFRICCFFFGILIVSGNNALYNAVGQFSNIQFPGKVITGVLCWKLENLKKLTLTLNRNGIYFFNSKEISPNMKNSILLFDYECENFQKIFNKDKQRQLQTAIFINTSCIDLPLNNYQPSQQIYITNNYLEFFQCYKTSVDSQWQMRLISRWEQTTSTLEQQSIKTEQLHDPAMTITQSIEVTYVASPSTIKTINDFRRSLYSEASSRFNHQLFNEIFMFLNITPVITFTANQHSLEKVSVRSKELIAQPVKVSTDNFTTYSFLTSLTPNKKSFLMRAPSLSAVSNVFTLPLELNVWYASYVLLAFIFVTLFIIVKVEWRFPDMIANKYRILYPKVMDVVQMQVGAIAQQGSEAEPTSGGGRIATFMIFLFFLFLYTAYSANIVALLGSTTTRVHGVRDLKDFNVKLGIDKEEFTKELFQQQDSWQHRALFKEKLAKDECYMTMDDGIGRIRNEFFAFHGDSDKIYKMIDKLYTDNEKCGFVEIPYLSEPELLVPIRKDSMYKEMLKIGLALFLERGMHNRIKNIIFAKQPQCYNGGGNFVSVSLLDCYFAFVIYGGGTAVSLLIFLFEIMVSRSKVKQRMLSAIKPRDRVLHLQKENDRNKILEEEQQQLHSASSGGSA